MTAVAGFVRAAVMTGTAALETAATTPDGATAFEIAASAFALAMALEIMFINAALVPTITGILVPAAVTGGAGIRCGNFASNKSRREKASELQRLRASIFASWSYTFNASSGLFFAS